MTTARQLATSERAYLVAPAGCGKTHLVVEALRHLDDSPQLVLTHTHAGVRALRDRLRTLSVSSGVHRVDTIAGFALRIASSFPSLSGCNTTEPVKTQWNAIYRAATIALSSKHIGRMVRSSYKGVLVDEYQDCTIRQHELILALSRLMPMRVVGDPLQAIFDFDEPTVDFDVHLTPDFERLSDLDTPYRWLNSNPELGEWLLSARSYIEQLRLPPFTQGPVEVMDSGIGQQVATCHRVASTDGSIVGIRLRASGAHSVAKRLRGRFTSMEEIESKDVLSASGRIDDACGPTVAYETIKFANKCMTQVATIMRNARQAYSTGRLPRPRKGAKNEQAVKTLNRLASASNIALIAPALTLLERLPNVVVYRREPLDAMMQAVALQLDNPEMSLWQAAWKVRDSGRRIGRRVNRRTISRTLLVKGLEFDHAIVLDVNEHIAPREGARGYRNLYVAMTRGSRSLTVLR